MAVRNTPRLASALALLLGAAMLPACSDSNDPPGGEPGDGNEPQECAPNEWADGETCRPLSACSADEYEAAAPTATSDRSCAALTICTADEFEMTPPSPTGDRVCGALTICGSGEEEVTPPTATSDRVCEAVCGADAFEVSPPSEGVARVCQDYTVCAGDEFERVAPTATRDRECALISECAAGEYELSPPSETADRSCAPVTTCGADEFEMTPPSATSDRVCEALSSCASDEFESTPPSATSDRVCEALTTCGSGEFESTPPTSTSDRVCQTITVCGPNEEELVPPTPTSDRVCGRVCDADEWYNDATDTCVHRTVCGPGTIIADPGTPSSDTTCHNCTPGEYCPGGSANFELCPLGDHDGDPSTPCMEIASIAVGGSLVCAINENSAGSFMGVTCANASGSGLSYAYNLTSTSGDVAKVVVGAGGACVVNNAAPFIECSSNIDLRLITDYYEDLIEETPTLRPSLIDFTLGTNGYCALIDLETEHVAFCVPRQANPNYFVLTIPLASDAQEVSLGDEIACARTTGLLAHDDGPTRVLCMRLQPSQITTLPVVSASGQAVSVGGEDVCVIENNGALRCPLGALSAPSNLSAREAIHVEDGVACAQGVDNSLSCWGAGVTPPPVVTGISTFGLGTGVGCLLTSSGDVECWEPRP